MSVTCLERHYGCGGSARGRIFLGALASAKYQVAMLCAYFDTNPFDNLLKLNRLAATDLAELRSAIRRQQLAVVSNVLNLQETIDALHSNTPEVIVPQLDLIASLIDWGRFVKPSDWLLRDDIKHFAWCGEPSSPFLRESVVEIVRDAVADIVRGRLPIDDFDDVVRKSAWQKTAFALGLESDNAEAASMMERLREDGLLPEFNDVFAIAAQDFAYHIAAKVGYAEECKGRGLDQLLSVRSVRMAVGSGLSVIYHRAFENKKLKRPLGTSRDLQHVVCAAAAADVFVTHDRELSSLVSRVPLRGFRVLTVSELLDEIRDGEPQPA
jgi:hypothetical protein